MSPQSEAVIRFTWSWPVLLALLTLILFPLYAPLFPTVEGRVMPVTGKIVFVDVHPGPDGKSTLLRMKYEKLRDCELLGVTADHGGDPLDFDRVDGGPPITVPTGWRISGVWRISVTDLSGIRIRWVHRCNLFWTTVTVGYP